MNDKDKLDKNLIGDDDFVAMMEADFEGDGKPVDVLSKKRSWTEIEAMTKDTLPNPTVEARDSKKDGDKFWQIGLALAACILLSVGISVLRPMLEREQGVKGSDVPVPVEMNAYRYAADGELVAFKVGDVPPPQNVVPMVHATRPVVAALLSIAENGTPEVIVARQSFDAGQEGGFVVGPDEIFSVEWTGETREVYCVVAFEDEADLMEELTRLQQDQAFTFDGNCLVLPEAK